MKTTQFYLLIFLTSFLFSHNGLAQNNTTFFGTGAGNGNTANSNSAFGKNPLSSNNSGVNNSAFGFESMRFNATGTANDAFGVYSLRSNTTGKENTAYGSYSLTKNTSGIRNVAIGHKSLEDNTTGSNNVSLGTFSLRNNNGSRNVSIGYRTAMSLLTGNDNVIIGNDINVSSNPSTTTVAGNDTEDSIIIGSTNAYRLFIHNNGYAGFGLGNYQIPQNGLELGLRNANTTGLRFRGFNGNTAPTEAHNGRVLTINENGDVVLTTDQVGVGGGSNDNIYTIDGTLAGNRTVAMNNNRLMFNTATNGAIYVGNTTNVNDNTNFPTTTGNYRLYVEGGILTEKVKVALRSTANWADYVFEKNYKLMSLRDVETYIKTNKHLPGIESAESLVESGLDLANMQAKQMEKIEELMLYIIEQDKKVEKQSKEIEELKALVKLFLEKSKI